MRNFILILFLFFISFSSKAQFTSSQKQYLNPLNLLKNSGAENGKTGWVSSGGAFTITTNALDVGFDNASFSFDASGVGYLETVFTEVPNLLKGNTCQVEIWYNTTDSNYVLQVEDFSTNILVTEALPSTLVWTKKRSSFLCPVSDTIKVSIISNGDLDEIFIDNVLLGSAIGTSEDVIVSLQSAYDSGNTISLSDASGPIVISGDLTDESLFTILNSVDGTQFAVFNSYVDATDFRVNQDLYHLTGDESLIPFHDEFKKFIYDPTFKYDATSSTLLVQNIEASNFINLPPFDSTKTVIDVNEVGHGFIVGNLIRYDGANWVYSSKNTDAEAEVFCLVSEIVDVDNFKCAMNGYVAGLTGLTAGETYFLDATGTFTLIEPTEPFISKPVFSAISATEVIFHNMRGMVGGTGGGALNLQDAYDGGNAITTDPATPVTVDDLELIDNFINSAIGMIFQYNGNNIAEIGNTYLGVTQLNTLRFFDDDSSNYVELKSPSVIGTNLTFTLPSVDGSNGQFLQTNGSGVLSFATVNTDASKTRRSFLQVGHGFSLGEILRHDGVDFVLAQADSDINAEAICIVSDVIDVDNFECTFNGYISGLAGLTAGETYFLDDAVAGGFTATEPTDPSISKPIFTAISATEIIFSNMRGLIGGAGGGALNLQDAYDGGNTITTDPVTPVIIDDLEFIDNFINSAIGTIFQYNGNDIALIESASLAINEQVSLKFYDDDSSNYVELKSPSVIGTNFSLTLPVNAGSNGQFLQTNGSGVLSFADVITDATKTRKEFNQVGHGFVVGNILKITGANTFALAQADSDVNAEVACIVSGVVDVDNFECTFNGYVSGLSGLTSGETYFLDETSAGDYTLTEPVDPDISKPVFVALSATEIIFNNMRGLVGGSGGGGGGSLQDAFDIGNIINTGGQELLVDQFTINDNEILAPNIVLDATSTSIIMQVNNVNELGVFSNYAQLYTENALRFLDADNSNYVALKSPSVVASDLTLTLPSADGEQEDFLKTNGSGQLSFSAVNSIIEKINQTAHGFSKCNVLRHNGTNFVLAQADSASNAEVYGVISRIIDVNNFVITISGNMDLTTCGLIAGETYFLSDTSAGALTATEPTDVDEVSLPLIKTKDANSGYLFQYRGRVIY